jgi:hypothetical protein
LASRAGVGAQRPEQDAGAEPDPLGHRRRGAERHQRLVVRVDDPIDRAERRELARLGAARPLDQLLSSGAGDGVRQADSDLHLALTTQAFRA